LDKTIYLRSMLMKSNFFFDKYDYDLILFLNFFNLAFEDEFPKNQIEDKMEKSKSKKSIFFFFINFFIFFYSNSCLITIHFLNFLSLIIPLIYILLNLSKTSLMIIFLVLVFNHILKKKFVLFS